MFSENETVMVRTEPRKTDPLSVKSLLSATGFFSDEEVQVGVELVEERLIKGLASGYHFVFLEEVLGLRTRLIGYTCFGEIPCTKGSYDLYWIAVDKSRQSAGFGSRLLEATEREVRSLGGRLLFAETSGREQYDPTHAFYIRRGYSEAARIPDFYAPGDAKIVYSKALSPASSDKVYSSHTHVSDSAYS